MSTAPALSNNTQSPLNLTTTKSQELSLYQSKDSRGLLKGTLNSADLKKPNNSSVTETFLPLPFLSLPPCQVLELSLLPLSWQSSLSSRWFCSH